jgi:hypothetical protein
MAPKIKKQIERGVRTTPVTPAVNGATPLLFDIRAAARLLSMSAGSIRKLIRQQRLRRIVNFRKILISEAELQRFAASAE